MKKIVPIFLALAIALFASGCLKEGSAGDNVTSASLLKVKEKPDKFSLEKAQNQNETAFTFAFSKEDLMAGDDFLTYVEAAKTVQDLEIAASNLQLITNTNLASGLNEAMTAFSNSFVDAFNSTLTPLLGLGTSGTATGSLIPGLTSTTGQSTSSSTSSGSTTSTGSGSSTSTSGSGTGSANASTSQADLDHQSLLSSYSQFQVYQSAANSVIAEVNSKPWQARDLVISDQTLVNLFSSSNTIFNFVRSHPTVSEGDKILSSVGDTLTSIYVLWGLGRYEAQTAFLMINLYYPGGSYITHAQEQLLLL